jgi:hypothetical protein
MYIVLSSMYETMSISTGLYPNLDLWNANKLHYITIQFVHSGAHAFYQLQKAKYILEGANTHVLKAHPLEAYNYTQTF